MMAIKGKESTPSCGGWIKEKQQGNEKVIVLAQAIEAPYYNYY